MPVPHDDGRQRAPVRGTFTTTARFIGLLAALSTIPTACSQIGRDNSLVTNSTVTPTEDSGAPTSDPDRARQLYLAVVAGLRHDKKSRAALGFLDDYDKVYPTDPRAGLMRADCLVDVGDLDGAAHLYRTLTGTPQIDAAAAAGLGMVDASRHDWNAAVVELKRAVALDPTSVRFNNNLGYAELKAGDLEGAEYTLRKAAEIDPSNVAVRNNLILVLRHAGKRDDLQRMLAQIDPRHRLQVERMLASAATQ